MLFYIKGLNFIGKHNLKDLIIKNEIFYKIRKLAFIRPLLNKYESF